MLPVLAIGYRSAYQPGSDSMHNGVSLTNCQDAAAPRPSRAFCALPLSLPLLHLNGTYIRHPLHRVAQYITLHTKSGDQSFFVSRQ